MQIRENDKIYTIDDESGLVVDASTIQEDEIRVGSRVEVDGEKGEVVAITSSFYGLAYGVRFDDGSIDELPEQQLKVAAEEKLIFDSPLHEVFERFSKYEGLPTYTNDEIDLKEREARWLNLRARSLVADPKLPLSEQNELGRVVIVTSNDLTDLKELRSRTEESEKYLSSFNRYSLANEVSGYGATLGTRGDTSWLDAALDGMEVVESTDADLAARATEVVASLSKEQLEDDEFMNLAASYHIEYLQIADGRAKKFGSYLARAREEKLKELPAEQKVASADGDLDDFDAAAFYL